MVALEDGPVTSPLLRRHLEPDPVCPQYVDIPGPHSMPRQDIKISVSFQGDVGLAQV